jgi:hypothetical protein
MIGRQAMSSDSLMKRNSWIVVAAGTLFDIAFCFVVALIFSPREPGSAFLILLATVWGVGLLIHLKSKLVKTLIYHLGGRRQRIEATLDELVRLRMPAGASYQNDASEYCRRVASDEDESKDARLYAGTMIGILTVMPLYSRTDTRQLHSVVEKALQKYSRMINRRHDKIGWVEEARTVIGVPNGERAAPFELPVR